MKRDKNLSENQKTKKLDLFSLEKQVKKESLLVRENSMKVLKEFEFL